MVTMVAGVVNIINPLIAIDKPVRDQMSRQILATEHLVVNLKEALKQDNQLETLLLD